ncbi:uncharacterized protein [Clytia hemisphaerica]|uniref:Macro domain-containing protein n=1 Tax=Clytia hemisphaerica TaxID=252671 RepID=A0A7M6DLL5_9CNID
MAGHVLRRNRGALFSLRTIFQQFGKSTEIRSISTSQIPPAKKYIDHTKYSINDVFVLPKNDPSEVQIIEKHGKAWHLFQEAKTSSIVHTVSGDFDMYNGLAREFAVNFKQTDQKALNEHNFPLGSVAVLPNGDHFIYYLVIRESWWDRGAYRPLREALNSMRKHAAENDVRSIAMGRLGAQCDGLNFVEVLKEVKDVFYDSNMELIIYSRRT